MRRDGRISRAPWSPGRRWARTPFGQDRSPGRRRRRESSTYLQHDSAQGLVIRSYIQVHQGVVVVVSPLAAVAAAATSTAPAQGALGGDLQQHQLPGGGPALLRLRKEQQKPAGRAQRQHSDRRRALKNTKRILRSETEPKFSGTTTGGGRRPPKHARTRESASKASN